MGTQFAALEVMATTWKPYGGWLGNPAAKGWLKHVETLKMMGRLPSTNCWVSSIHSMSLGHRDTVLEGSRRDEHGDANDYEEATTTIMSNTEGIQFQRVLNLI